MTSDAGPVVGVGRFATAETEKRSVAKSAVRASIVTVFVCEFRYGICVECDKEAGERVWVRLPLDVGCWRLAKAEGGGDSMMKGRRNGISM